MKKYYFTSESVTEGHPDKLCDLISDTILDECLKLDENSRVAVETFAMKNQIVIAGQITTKAKLDYEIIARNVIKEIGFDNDSIDMDYRTVKIDVNITKQSPDISIKVDNGGAGDQGIMFGYATNETDNYMPYSLNLAHKLSRRLTEVRKKGIIPYLRPDGKTQITMEYIDDKATRVDTILISASHLPGISLDKIRTDIKNNVILEVIDKKLIDEDTKIYINPTGLFSISGPLADAGLTGRKIIVDTYGGASRHGGGAFSGKDSSKVDRSAAYMLRHIALNIVANKYADKCEIQVSYAIGMKKVLSVYVNTFGTNKISEEEIIEIINKNFDLSPNAIIDYLNLKQPIYSKTTNYGHFGKKELHWEKVIKLDDCKKMCKIS